MDENLIETIEREINRLLMESRIFNTHSYGWDNLEEPSEEGLGYAMWEIDGPRIDDRALLGQRPVDTPPRGLDGPLVSRGEDFIGMMDATHLSLGLALLWKDKARRSFGMNEFYALHCTGSMLTLDIASDRVRDVMIIACTGAAPGEYNRRAKGDDGERYRAFVTPFEDAADMLTDRGVKADEKLLRILGELLQLAMRIAAYRRRRNEIVHQVATWMATASRNSIEEIRQLHERERSEGFVRRELLPADEEAWRAEWMEADRRRRAEVDEALKKVVEWYNTLLRAGSLVFQVERLTR